VSLQVGAFCYANAVEAGRAACSQFQPVTSLSGTLFKTITCTGSDATTGSLSLDLKTFDTAALTMTEQTFSQSLNYSDCVNQDYVDAAEVIFPALVAVWVVWICGRKMMDVLGWSRGDHV
jgi:hypothetical protein